VDQSEGSRASLGSREREHLGLESVRMDEYEQASLALFGVRVAVAAVAVVAVMLAVAAVMMLAVAVVAVPFVEPQDVAVAGKVQHLIHAEFLEQIYS